MATILEFDHVFCRHGWPNQLVLDRPLGKGAQAINFAANVGDSHQALFVL